MQLLSQIYLHAVALSALSVVALHQILKLKFIPLTFFNRYPVPGLILLSIASSIVVAWHTAVNPHSLGDWVILVATTAVTAALTYVTTFKNWSQLRQMEGEA